MKSLFSAYWEFTKNLENGVKKYNLNYGNPKIIIYLINHEGCRQVDIAKDCYVESATLSTVLSKMEANGLIERKRPDKNRRSYAIYPTQKGREIFEGVKKQLGLTTDAAFAGFSEEEKLKMQSYLDRVTDNLKKANDR